MLNKSIFVNPTGFSIFVPAYPNQFGITHTGSIISTYATGIYYDFVHKTLGEFSDNDVVKTSNSYWVAAQTLLTQVRNIAPAEIVN
jgi:hypothetical protein